MKDTGTPPKDAEKSEKKETMRFEEKEFRFGKPMLKHRGVVLKILEAIGKSPGDMKGIALVVQKRNLTPEQAAVIDESDYTKDEQLIMRNYSGLEKILKSRQDNQDHPDWDASKDVWDVVEIPNDELSNEELNWKQGQWDSFGVMNEMVPEVLIVTLRSVTGVDKKDLTIEWLEENLEYTQSMQLFKNGLKYIMEAVYEIQSVRFDKSPVRKN